MNQMKKIILEEYWLKKLPSELPRISLPLVEHLSGKAQVIAEESATVFALAQEIPGPLADRLAQAARNSDQALFILVLSGLDIVLERYAGIQDVLVGTIPPVTTGDDNIVFCRSHFTDDMTVKELIMQNRREVQDAFNHWGYPVDDIIKMLEARHKTDAPDLFNAAFLYEPFQKKNHFLERFPFVFTLSGSTGKLSLHLQVRGEILPGGHEILEQLSRNLLVGLEQMLAQPDQQITAVNILDPAEKNRLLYEFNNTDAEYPQEKTIHQLFTEQLEKTPGHTAIIYRDQNLTYGELNARTLQLAGILVTAGVTPDTIVGIMVERSPEMIVGLLGILKSGGAYLPIDPEYPQERIDYMLKDSGAKLLVTTNDKEGEKVRRWEGEKVLLEEIFNSPKSSSYPLTFLPSYLQFSSNLAYTIYTSGSTGKPKGVMIEHRSIVNTLHWRSRCYGFDSSDAVLQIPSFSFDSSVEDIFTPLICGSKLVLIPQQQRSNVEYLGELIKRCRVTHFLIVPNLYNAFLQEMPRQLEGLRSVTVAGDNFTRELVEEHFKQLAQVKLYNEYGPTENSVCSTVYLFSQEDVGISIGKPIANVACYIVDKIGNVAPLGVPGELYLAGAGLARSYLNSPQLTQEKFVENPFAPGQRMYRTGDLVRRFPGGNLEFLGRADGQVKIRGFRIELGEIENRLLQKQEITAAVVVAKENKKTGKYLCAYTVSEKEIPTPQLTAHLAAALPVYMIPTYFVRLEKIPLTSHGKVDRKVLETGSDKDAGGGIEYTPPGSDIERLLAETWEKVLSRTPIGINDNFFASGGDSIKAIQISARMNRAGYKLGIRDIFQNPTIARLAPFMKKTGHIAAQIPVTGAVPLTPIQVEFFQNHKIEPHHFNQAVLFYSKESIEEQALNAIFFKLQEHHDALRMIYKYKREQEEIIQENLGIKLPPDIRIYDFRKRNDAAAALAGKVNEIQACIDLKTGPLMKVGLFHLVDGDRLLIVIHHLVVDGVSWRILSEDIEILYRQYKKGEPLVLPPRTDSFKTWAERLVQYAGSPSFLKEKNYWAALESQTITPIPKDFAEETNYKIDAEKFSFSLEEKETYLLLTRAHEVFGTEINDLLLTALGVGIKQTFGSEKITVALEGHGREEIFEDVDIKRTVGWFTVVYPVVLDFSHNTRGQDTGRQIKEIKEHLRRIPSKGIGYGILKYLTAPRHKEGLHFTLKPQLIFNYLGQFDADAREMSFSIAAEAPGNMTDHRSAREFELDVQGMIAGGRLFMTISYNKKQYRRETVETLMNNYRESLSHIITYCCSRAGRELTPSDFSYPGLTIDRVDQLQQEFHPYPIEDIYTLSPLQEGMLFQWMYEQDSPAYFLQTSYRLRGELDIALVKQSFNRLLQRHQALRALFVHQGVERPIQVILKDKEIDFHYEDIHHIAAAAEKEQWLEDYREKDRRRSFDLTRATPMRVGVIRLDRDHFEMIWSHHHILMDGWCRGILIAEYLEIFAGLLEKRFRRLPPAAPYRDYIQWLENQPREQGHEYWRQYLQGSGETASIPKLPIFKRKALEYRMEAVSWKPGKMKDAGLTQLAARNQVTLSTVMHTLWGILLSKYCDKQDVVFGSVVSGRPSEIQGVEAMIGLFINTVPFRIRFDGSDTFTGLIRQVQKQALDSETHHYFPLTEIQAQSPLKQDLFDHILAFENYPAAAQIEGITDKAKQDRRSLQLDLSGVKIFEQTHYDFVVVISNEPLTIKIQYNIDSYDRKSVTKIPGHFDSIIDRVLADEQIEIKNIAVQYDLLEANVTAGEDEYENFGF